TLFVTTQYMVEAELFFHVGHNHRALHSFPTRRSSDLDYAGRAYALNPRNGHQVWAASTNGARFGFGSGNFYATPAVAFGREEVRSEEHTSELQSQSNLVCRLLLEKKNRRHRSGRAARA